MNKILLTGGAGYLGSILVAELLKLKHRVTVVDGFYHGEETLAAYPELTIVRANVRDEAIMKPLLADADIILPFAGISGAANCDRSPEFSTATNLHAVQWMMKQVSGHQQILFPSSLSVYGHQEKEVDERSVPAPLSLYGRDKLEAEKAVLEHPGSTVLRFAPCFGISPKMRLDLLVNSYAFRAFTRRYLMLPDARVQRCSLHVRDAVAAVLLALKKWESVKGEIFNVTNPETQATKWDLASAVQEQLPDCLITETFKGKKVDPRDYAVASKKIAALGFRPKHTLKAGIAELIHGFLARGETRPSAHRDNR